MRCLTLREIELPDSHADGSGRYQNHLMACVLDITEHFAERLHMPDVDSSGRVRQRGRPDFYYDSHGTISHTIKWHFMQFTIKPRIGQDGTDRP